MVEISLVLITSHLTVGEPKLRGGGGGNRGGGGRGGLADVNSHLLCRESAA